MDAFLWVMCMIDHNEAEGWGASTKMLTGQHFLKLTGQHNILFEVDWSIFLTVLGSIGHFWNR